MPAGDITKHGVPRVKWQGHEPAQNSGLQEGSSFIGHLKKGSSGRLAQLFDQALGHVAACHPLGLSRECCHHTVS